MKKFHITYFVNGQNEKYAPLLHGVTIEAENITFALNRFLNETGIAEDRIKYIIQL